MVYSNLLVIASERERENCAYSGWIHGSVGTQKSFSGVLRCIAWMDGWMDGGQEVNLL